MENLVTMISDTLGAIFVDPVFVIVLIVLLCIRKYRDFGVLVLGLGIIFGFKMSIIYGIAIVICAIIMMGSSDMVTSIRYKNTNGKPGPEGPRGYTGPQGDRGKSAYEYAVEGGYDGSEEEFTASMALIPEIAVRMNTSYTTNSNNNNTHEE